jgi:aspartate aminotransferase-like enzyme
VADGTKVLVVVNGYFGDRIVLMCERYGAKVRRLDLEWARRVNRTRCDRLSGPGRLTSLRWFMQKRRPAC